MPAMRLMATRARMLERGRYLAVREEMQWRQIHSTRGRLDNPLHVKMSTFKLAFNRQGWR
jgi:hypothetical protein